MQLTLKYYYINANNIFSKSIIKILFTFLYYMILIFQNNYYKFLMYLKVKKILFTAYYIILHTIHIFIRSNQ